jgi:two-component system LytT family response regulator
MIRTVIVDDEPLARSKLVDLLKLEREVEVVAVCAGGAEAITAIAEHTPDLLFLDVQMPEVDGFDVLRALGPEHAPEVVFVTAHDRFAIRAFEVHALDYLLKPFSRDRFGAAIERAMQRIAGGGIRSEARILGLLEELHRKSKPLERLPVTVGPRTSFVQLCDVDWIETEGNYLRLHGVGNASLVRGTMKTLEEKLDGDRFVRISRSAIVNVARVANIETLGGGSYVVVMADGTRLMSGRLYSRRLRRMLENPL